MIKATVISGLVAFVLMVIVLVVFAAYYDQPGQAEPLLINGSDMVLHRGRGYKSGHQLVVTATDSEQRIRIISTQLSFKAKDMPFMAWTFSHFSPRTGVWVGWINSDNPQKLNMMPAILPYDSTAVYRMKDHPDWTGEIVALGFGFDRQMYEEFSLESVEIRPYSMESMLESIWDEWTAFEGWTLKSINVIKGGYVESYIRPVLILSIWSLISFLVFVANQNKQGVQNKFQFLVLFILSAWLAHDILWQINLFRQNILSFKQYSGKTLDEKRLLGVDSGLVDFSKQVKNYIKGKQTRVFLTGKGQSNGIIYEQPRLQYYLMPYNVSYFESSYAVYFPSIEDYGYKYNIGYYISPNEYVLVNGKDDRIMYERKTNKMIIGSKYKFMADLLYESNSGSLYYILDKL